MKRSKALWGLVALNAALAGVLAWKVSPDNTAHAQAVGPGDYLMVPARVSGVSNGFIYVVDTRNEVLGGFVYDNNTKALAALEPIDLNRVFGGGARR